MAAGNITVSLPQMIDLALNVPEHGSVNFNLLQAILHVIVQQLELAQCKIEFRGNDGEKVQNLMAVVKPDATIKITEYVVSPAKDAGKVVNRPGQQQEGAINIDQVGSKEKLETVVLVEPGASSGDGYTPCVISRKQLDEMNAELAALKEKVRELAELPGNIALIDALRGAGIEKGTPLLDMFQMMTLAKKVEANEGGLEKMASMIEDLAKQGSVGEAGIPGASTVGEALSTIQDRLQNIEGFLDSGGEFKPIAPGESGGGKGGGKGTGAAGGRPSTAPGGGKGAGGAEGGATGSKSHLETEEGGVSILMPEIDTNVPDLSGMNHDDFANFIREELMKIKEEIQTIYTRIGMLFHLSEEFTPEEILSAIKAVVKKHASTAAGTTVDTTDLPPGERLERLEDQYNGTNEQIASLDSTFNQEINNIHTQFAEMEKAFGTIMEKIHFGMPGGDSAVAGETLGELYDKLMGLQSDMENLAETAGKLVEDKEDKQRVLEVLTEQVEFLKTVKADKEDLEDALADKADACAINRKVSHDQFDTACDELSRGIEEALAKLTQQEELWQQALDEIQKEIGNKLDRMELGPLRDFVNNKLKMLQQRLKALTALKKETEAAGTKKFLRNVNCISCDKDVVMRKEMDPSLLPQPYSLPPSRSMGPYLAYELDALRKQQKSLPNSRNLNHFESALHQKSPRPGEDHICNRYCGGSHTITTPQQRVTRLGHFLTQWGPEAQPVGDGTGKPLDDKLTVVGTSNLITPVPEPAMSPKVSKIESTEKRESMMKEARRSTLPTDRKLSVGQERRASKGSGRISITSPKPSGAEVSEKRRSSVGSGQRVSTVKRPSQGSGGSVQKEEKSPQLSTSKIPEETASQVEKENEEGAAPSSPGAPPAEGDAPPADSASASAVPRTSQAESKSPQGGSMARVSGQISGKGSRRGSKTSAAQVSAKPSAVTSPQKSPSVAEQAEAAPPSPPAEQPAEQPTEEPPAEAPPAEE